MCFFRRKSKRAAAAAAAAASAASATATGSAASESPSVRGRPAAEPMPETATSSVAVLTDRSLAGGESTPEAEGRLGGVSAEGLTPVAAGGDAEGTTQLPAKSSAEPRGATEELSQPGATELPTGTGLSVEVAEPPDEDDPPSDEDDPSSDEVEISPPAPLDGAQLAEQTTSTPLTTSEPPADQATAAPLTPPDEAIESAVPSSEDMAPPQRPVTTSGPRDQVWGQDIPGLEGAGTAALNQLIEAVTMPASTEDTEHDPIVDAPELPDAEDALELPTADGSNEMTSPHVAEHAPADSAPEMAGPDSDLMEELPTDRPVPADAIKRASEALDAAVNAAPAVIGYGSQIEDDESVAFVDTDFTVSDAETGAESEPDGVASDYSVRVTDPIPVQGLSAPGVSRETSGSAQMSNGTQQPTGGPDGSDDERRSALIATVPAVDETTPVAAELAMDARRRIELQGRRFPRPPKTRIITVANQKGGVGKTTTTVNVAAGLAQSGLNVLVIDNDPQGNASTALGIEHRAGTPSVYEVLVEGESLASTVQQCPDVPNLWGVPATIDLSGSEIELVSLVSRETRLRKAIDKYLSDRIAAGEERIDYVLIDCPPSLGLLTVNAFVAGREVFIPIQCEYYALEGLSQLLKTIDLIRSHLNPELRVSSILLTMYDGRTNLAQQVAGEVRSHFPAETFKTTIPRSVRISEAPSYGQTVMTYDATSTGALAYLQASRELAERGQGGSSPRRAIQAEPVGAQD